jgi:hypothetical protein
MSGNAPTGSISENGVVVVMLISASVPGLCHRGAGECGDRRSGCDFAVAVVSQPARAPDINAPRPTGVMSIMMASLRMRVSFVRFRR